MAGSTRLELATSGVTGRRSNQLNYDPALTKFLKAIRGQTTGHQKRSHTREAPAPSGETKVPPLQQATRPPPRHVVLVGGTGFEPVTTGV